MTSQNPYLIENKKPVETVQELKNEVPFFEEFLSTYEYDEHRANLYEAEYQDRVLYSSKIGPRKWAVKGNRKVGCKSSSKDYSNYSSLVFDTEIGTVTGGVFGTATTSLASQGTKSIGHKAAQEIAKTGCKVTEEARLLISCGKTMAELANDLRMLEKAYDIYKRHLWNNFLCLSRQT